ncbi:arylsulfatase B precursor, putative, partial [Ixodes scapularis]
KRPNIVFILGDDLGWGDVSFHGSTQIPTPNIDVLAGDGVILNNYYVLPTCTPSRAALMTGLYPIHTGMQSDIIEPAAPWGLPLENKILPQHFRDLGYDVNMIGKWHLGFFKTPYVPIKRGFDTFFGFYTGSNDYYNHTSGSENNEQGVSLVATLTAAWGRIAQGVEPLLTDSPLNVYPQPFFCYFSHHAVHSALMAEPFQAPARNVLKFPYIGESNRTIYAGMLDALDESVGRVVEALDNAGMLEDTIIVFSSDNGGAPCGEASNQGFNWPLRGAKFTLWEGSVRVPAFVWSPKFLKQSRVSNQLMHISDWLPTLYTAAGGDVSALGVIDGVDMWHSLTHSSASKRKEILLNIDASFNISGLRYKQYKLVVGGGFDGELNDHYYFTGGTRPTNNIDELRNESTMARVLKKFYEKQRRSWSPLTWSENVAVDCRRDRLTENFVPMQPPYLFNIEQDPCELNNLAKTKVHTLRFLMKKLDAYNSTVVPSLFQPDDPRAYPEYHGGIWSPWLD